MAEQSESWKFWTQGLDDWRAERLSDASIAFQEAIAKAAPDDVALVDYYQSLGQVLDELGEAADARAALERALELSMQRHKDHASIQVAMARCFLAEHFLRVLRYRDAVEVTEPSVAVNTRVAGLLLSVRARAFRGMGRFDRAREEAHRAMDLATTEEERAKLAQELGALI
jgi:tetratricopeptide (TPR) repeat protein